MSTTRRGPVPCVEPSLLVTTGTAHGWTTDSPRTEVLSC
jgi:hypothetical protein